MVTLEETNFRLLRILEKEPEISQRELAEALGVSLGKANYCLRELVKRGWVKVGNFTNSSNKRAYMYYLTPKGAEEKVRVTYAFLRRKVVEFEVLKAEIEMLRAEESALSGAGADELKPISLKGNGSVA